MGGVDSSNNDDGKGSGGESEGSIGSEGTSGKRGNGNSGGGKVEDEGGIGDAGGIVAKTRGRRGVSEVGDDDGLCVVEVEVVGWTSKRSVPRLAGAYRAVLKNGRNVVG